MQLTGQAAQYGLKEAVNGLHAESAVILEYHVKCQQGVMVYGLLVICDGLLDLSIIICRSGQVVAYAVELRQYALLHLSRGLVGKSYRQDMTVALRLADEHGDILYGQTESFA